jgi:4-diphosphocytidyl-2-C-methyl-D-erythritol kinase
MSLPLHARAPAKINLGLCLGPTRADGRHELVSVMQSISLADELTLERAPTGDAVPTEDGGAAQHEDGADEVVCPGVAGPNLAAAALAAFRAATGWDAPPLRLSIVKRIPVAAGLGGGSADAAATLRLAAEASGLGDGSLLLELAAGLGADVPAQVVPGRWLATGAGERLESLPDPNPPFGVLVLPLDEALSTAAVYGEADRLGLVRSPADLQSRHHALHGALDFGVALPAPELLVNDLQPAALSLCPQIVATLAQVRDAGADVTLVSGSGPTVVGLFARANGAERVSRAIAGLGDRAPAPVAAAPVDSDFGAPIPLNIEFGGPVGNN